MLALFMYRRAFQQLDFADGAALMVIILLINIVLSVVYLYWTRERN
jgi:ABC-type sugar transport system permease subunit